MATRKKDEREVKKGGDEVTVNNSSGNGQGDMTFHEWNMTRRDLMLQAAFAGLLLAFPGVDSAFAAVAPPRAIPFTRNKTGDGIVGPFGEVRIFNVGGEALPAVVSAFDGSAIMDCTGRSPFVRFGASTDLTAIILSGDGVQFGAAKPEPWTADVIKKMIAALVADRRKARGAMLLRSALHTSYHVAIAQTKSKVGTGMATAMSKGAAGYAIGALVCTASTVVDTEIKTITDTVAVVLTAEKQYQACYDQQITVDPCKSAALVGLGGVCAAGICAAKTFVDIVVGWTTVVHTVAEEVTREVVSCVLPAPGQWPNPWNLSDKVISAAAPQPKAPTTQTDIDAAIKLLQKIGTFLGPLGKCLLSGKWSLAQLNTQLNLGGGNIVIPYGVQVCISAACATQLIAGNMFGELTTVWTAAASAVVALAATIPGPTSAAFVSTMAALGFTAAPAVTAALAGLPEIVIIAAAVILAMIILVLWWGTAIFGQLLFDQQFTNDFADNSVCIVHPTLAIAAIQLIAAFFNAPSVGAIADLIPPIVTG